MTLAPESLAQAAKEIARITPADAQLAALVVGEVLLAQAEQRSAAVPPTLIASRMTSHGATDAIAETKGVRPLDVLRHGPRSETERAMVSVLLAQHLGSLLERDGVNAVRALLPAIDWLEFTGPYAPYSAVRHALGNDSLARFDELLRGAAIEASSEPAAAAVRALRGVSPFTPSTSARPPAVATAVPPTGANTVIHGSARAASAPGANLAIAGELEGLERGPIARTIGILTGWSAVRGTVLGAARQIFSLRRPATVTLEGELLRVVGHTEIMGRTLRTFDVRYSINELVELAREARFPALPAALSLFAVCLGALFGARAVVEGAGVAYFPLIAIGLGLILAGVAFDLLLRALFPGLRGNGRLVIRARDARSVVLTNLPLEEMDRLLDAIDRRFGGAPRTVSGITTRSGASALSPAHSSDVTEQGGTPSSARVSPPR